MNAVDLKELITKTIPVHEYIEKMAQPYKERFLKRKQSYQLDGDVMQKLKDYVEDNVILVFSADWCKDCAKNVAVLALLTEKTGMKVYVFGGLKVDALNPKETWRIPPSPYEVKTFNVQSVPQIIILNNQGKKIGTINENPKPENTLEEEILQIIQQT